MKTVKRVGFFKELSYGGDNTQSLRDAVGKLPKELVNNVAQYLQSGETLVISPGIARDVLSHDSQIIGSLRIVTDGEYAWPTDLAHYVTKYHVNLPSEFLQHMREANWRISTVNLEEVKL